MTDTHVSQLTGLNPISQPVPGIACTRGHRHRTFFTPRLILDSLNLSTPRKLLYLQLTLHTSYTCILELGLRHWLLVGMKKKVHMSTGKS